jgi:acetoin:2,6-dichlorophenolindophenol oxidoreductase subunit alpha
MCEDPALDDATRVELFRTMVLLRTFHDALRREIEAATYSATGNAESSLLPQQVGPNRPGGMRRSLLGCEPMAAGFGIHLATNDAVTSPRRPHYMAIARGIDLRTVVNEAVGTVHGHEQSEATEAVPEPVAEVHQLRPSATGAGYLPALGQAFAFQQQGTGQVAVAILGRSAADEEGFWSAARVADTWNLPLIFLLCDDGEAPRPRPVDPDHAIPLTAHGVCTIQVSSDAVEHACLAAGKAVSRARAGTGPTIVEVQTAWPVPARLVADRGAGTDSDPMSSDPIRTYDSALRQRGVLDVAQVAEIRSWATAQVTEAVSGVAEHHGQGAHVCTICARTAS